MRRAGVAVQVRRVPGMWVAGLSLGMLGALAVIGPAAPAEASPTGTEAAAGPAVDNTYSPEWVMTEYGPLGPGDRKLMEAVRLAGLWEGPAGTMAAEKGASPRVREIGAVIAREHAELDKIVIDAANKLAVALPTEPSDDQKFWLSEFQEANGADFDRVFVDRLRASHGKIFPVIGNVRAGTRNDLVRNLAKNANDFVLHHLELLESTGLVDYNELPEPAAAKANFMPAESLVEAAQARADAAGMSPAVIWLVLAAALVAGAATAMRVFRSR